MPAGQILNVSEIATFFHFPTLKLATIHNVSWHKTILSDAPENLPVAEGLTSDEKEKINFFAKTEFKNKLTNFGIKTIDRRKHAYVIGKTGTGKSTLIANMAINDMRNRRGFAVIDPHGDLCEILLNYVPSYRVNDVIYLDPSNAERAFSMNPLEIQNASQRELVVSGIVAIFHKLYGNSWGPRLEYILRNTILSIIDLPDATLLMVPEMLANEKFRAKVIPQLKDEILQSFWVNEFANYTDRLRAEAVLPIQNKVGQFISSSVLRNILKSPKSTIDLDKVMNEGKILLLNLSQGRLGEDNAALLGAMTITKLQLAAMNRVNMKEEDRRDFYLYVDEFQNFATSSFIKILSEARKYRLNLILANQYIAQIPEDVRAAIFGNAGTMLSFIIGAQDAPYMAKEFGERFKEEDLLALGNYQAITKLAIDGITQPPFLAYTLPLPKSITQNKEKVLKMALERYTKPV
ncbi:type IV secretion system DNA-binding domain-containing protein [Candidatus Microgenomates bacterium]|nr:type IV secretion system DNA-binding domain-containing protein [Candidatus Microgenomates bacterium]